MSRIRLLLLLMLLALPAVGFAQETQPVDFDAMVAELNAKCPIEYEDGWALSSVTNSADTSNSAVISKDSNANKNKRIKANAHKCALPRVRCKSTTNCPPWIPTAKCA